MSEQTVVGVKFYFLAMSSELRLARDPSPTTEKRPGRPNHLQHEKRALGQAPLGLR